MRRITRRIGLFGGPGAMVKAAGGAKRRRTRAANPLERAPLPQTDGPVEPVPQKKSWFRWLRGPKN